MRHFALPLALLCLALPLVTQAQTQPLNDTGITWSGHATSGNASSCDANHPAGQDCHYGRDADASLVKTGAGHAGFDFTRICNSGEAEGTGNCPSGQTTIGSGSNEWACTKDNVTGLVWEVKTTSGLRGNNHVYTWYDSASPDGNYGSIGDSSTCSNPAPNADCSTENYVKAVNAVGLCGWNNWRMPTIRELVGIMNMGKANPTIDDNFFPNTPGRNFWVSTPFSGAAVDAWVVDFNIGYTTFGFKTNKFSLLIVRSSL